ncbi:MAG TPA: carboxylating nicotinate-nucleotide diphosphorylase [Gemmatimonadaceae bacterium]|nr:carboxylating nicotinate-nucleotide diphosphorylase [Gemmatimonadaceae bacterium]
MSRPAQPAPTERAPAAPLPADRSTGTGPFDFPFTPTACDALVRSTLEEDGAFADVTTLAIVPADRQDRAVVVARRAGVIAGLPLAISAFRLLNPHVALHVEAADGTRVAAGAALMRVSGPTRALLSAERVALNFLQRLSGIATLTARYVDAVARTHARILDTRKTTPGLRALEKYAVRVGGGENHRLSLHDAVLIKDNHLAAMGGDVAAAIARAREHAAPGMVVEVECESADQVRAGVEAGADIILLDNMSPTQLSACVALVHGRALTEASGGVTLDTVRAIAESGVDRISVGALTHSAPALDIALDFQTD